MPDLASGYPVVSADNKTVTVSIRPGVDSHRRSTARSPRPAVSVGAGPPGELRIGVTDRILVFEGSRSLAGSIEGWIGTADPATADRLEAAVGAASGDLVVTASGERSTVGTLGSLLDDLDARGPRPGSTTPSKDGRWTR